MLLAELPADRRQQRSQSGVGDIRQWRAGFLWIGRAVQHMGAELKNTIVGPAAYDVERILIVARLVQRFGELSFEIFEARRHIEETLGQDTIEQRRIAAQPLGQPGRGAHDLGHEIQQSRVADEKGKHLNAGW